MELTMFHLGADKLNLYADRGNVMVLKKRCQWRGIDLKVEEVNKIEGTDFSKADILFIGGGSDREQSLFTNDLMKMKDEFKSAIEDGVSCLTICGGYQFLGDYYQLQDGEKLPGLGIIDLYTESKPGRLIGNVLIESQDMGKIVGFENHGGRTYHNYDAFGVVLSGHGNNGEDKKEGIKYKNLLGTYLHGPILPKNPTVADFLISRALERKYGKGDLERLNDNLETDAKNKIKQMLYKY